MPSRGLLRGKQAELLGDASELAGLAAEGRPSGDLHQIARAGEQAWREGDIARALSHVLAVREAGSGSGPETVRLQRQALLTFATYARNLGKFRLARHLLDDLLRQPLERDLLVDVLVLAASVWRGLGSLEGAQALIERAAKRADPEDPVRLARVHHQWAKLLLEASQPASGSRHLSRALALYRETGDAYNELRARLLRTEILEALRRDRLALSSARRVVAEAGRRQFGRIKVFAHLELGRLLLARGEIEPALRELRRGRAGAVLLGDRKAELLARARLSSAYGAVGEHRAAGIERRQAARLAESVDEVSVEIDLARGNTRLLLSTYSRI